MMLQIRLKSKIKLYKFHFRIPKLSLKNFQIQFKLTIFL